MSAPQKQYTPKWIKCPHCKGRGFTHLIDYIQYYLCSECGFETPLRVLNTKQYEKI